MFIRLCLLIFLTATAVSAASLNNATTSNEIPDYLIVGAGGGGLQMALLLQKHNLSYVILEKTDKVGAFWTQVSSS